MLRSLVDYDKVNEINNNLNPNVFMIVEQGILKFKINQRTKYRKVTPELLRRLSIDGCLPIKILFNDVNFNTIKKVIECIRKNNEDIRAFVEHNAEKKEYPVLFAKEIDILKEEHLEQRT